MDTTAQADTRNDIITSSEAANRCSMTKREFEEAARRGVFPRIKISGKVIRYSWAAVLNALDERTMR